MRYFSSIFFVLTLQSNLLSQDSTYINPLWGKYAHHDIFIGYNGSPTENSDLRTNYHSIEIAFWKSKVISYHHPVSSSLFVTQEIGKSSKTLIHGTKIGGQVTAMLFIFGVELTHHTDYESHTISLSPYFGYGGYGFKLSAAWRGRLTNKNFLPLSQLNFNLSFRIFSLKSRKIEDLTSKN